MRSKLRSTVMTMMVGVALADGTALADGSRGLAVEAPRVSLPGGSQSLSWTEELSTGEGTGELVRTREGLLFEPSAVMRRPEGLRRLTGLYTFPARTLERPVDTVRPRIHAKSDLGMDVEVDVRVRTASGWSEWSTTTAGQPVRLPQAGTVVQVRLALMADEHGRGPLVNEVTVEATLEASPAQADVRPMAALAYRVYATREGLVGGTTANGHVIRSNDRFVALPSRRALASNGGNEYQVKVCYSKTGKCTTTSVWDVGPWNTKDDYWNPSSIRQMWKSLPQGKPEAQAAYLEGFNGGLDEFGRRPPNPAGIDLADGTFWSDLGMTNNDYVTVTYLWTTGGSAAFKGSWSLRDANSGGTPTVPAFQVGTEGDVPVVGDWNGDGKKTVGIYRPSTNLWHLRNSNTSGAADIAAFTFGNADDIQLAGDWNGDGTDTIGIYRPSTSTFFLRNSNSTGAHDVTFTFGSIGDVPVVGDWNGDGKDTVGVYRPSTNMFYLRNTLAGGSAELSFSFGGPDDVQVTGDWNGDGIDTIGVFRKGTWFLRNSNSAGAHDITFTYGAATNTPVTGDWNGDGIDTVGVAQ